MSVAEIFCDEVGMTFVISIDILLNLEKNSVNAKHELIQHTRHSGKMKNTISNKSFLKQQLTRIEEARRTVRQP